MTEPKKKEEEKKKFPPLYFIIAGIVFVVILMIWVAQSMVGDGKDIISSVANKPAPAQMVAGNTASSTPSSVAKGNILPASTAKDVPTAPATGEVSTARVEVKAENGKLRVDFDPCCNCKPASAPSKAPKKAQHKHAPVAASAPAETAPAPKNAAFWGWVHPNSSDAKPMQCYADRQINGKPARCSSVLVEPANTGETEDAWRTRVAGLVGIKVGVKTDKGTISSTRNADVVVN